MKITHPLFALILLGGCQAPETIGSSTHAGSVPENNAASNPAVNTPTTPNTPSASVANIVGGPANPCSLPQANACVTKTFDEATNSFTGPPLRCDGTQFKRTGTAFDQSLIDRAKRLCEQTSGTFIEDGHCPNDDGVMSVIKWSQAPRQTEWGSGIYRVYYEEATRKLDDPSQLGLEITQRYDMEARSPRPIQNSAMYKCGHDGTILQTWEARRPSGN